MSPKTPDHDQSLINLPVELQIQIYRKCDTFSDVVALAETCGQMRDVWLEHTSQIYDGVAPKAILCEKNALEFLRDQNATEFRRDKLDVQIIAQLLRNARVVSDAVKAFERDLMPHVKFPGMTANDPPLRATMSKTERLRFVRAYYQLWGLLKLGPAQDYERLTTMPLKQLFQMQELVLYLTVVIPTRDTFGPGPLLKHPWYPGYEGTEWHIDYARDIHASVALQDRVLRILEDRWEDAREGRRLEEVGGYECCEELWTQMVTEGCYPFLVLWDHWQDNFKKVVCGDRLHVPDRLDLIDAYLWDEGET